MTSRSGFGATFPFTMASGKFGNPLTVADYRTIKDGPLSNPQRPLNLRCGNRSSCPTAVIHQSAHSSTKPRCEP